MVEHLQPLIVSDAASDNRFARAKSVVDLKLSSVMCVPLIYRKDLLGVIYLGNDSVTDLFTDRDSSLLKVYAAQSSLVIFHALQLNQLRHDNKNLRSQLQAASQGEMIGTCPPMRQVFQVLRRVAPRDLSVLILGESGTGKELVARAIHRPRRARRPFVAINCGAIPENLLESELFGHAAGALHRRGRRDKSGCSRRATAGRCSSTRSARCRSKLQVKLLRVLQERVIARSASIEPRPVDIRVVAATNKELRGGRAGPVPRGPVLPAQRDDRVAAAAPGARGRRGGAGPVLPQPVPGAVRGQGPRPDEPGAAGDEEPLLARQRAASSRTG